MNKLAIFVVFAFVGCVFAHGETDIIQPGDEEFSALSLIPSDEDEIAYLEPEMRVFEDYCIQTRDELKSFLKETANGGAATIYDALFGSMGEIADELVNAQRNAVQESTLIIEKAIVTEPANSIPSKAEVKDDLDKTIENLEKPSLYSTMVSTVSEAAKNVIRAIVETAKTEFFQRLALLRARFTAEDVKEKLEEACGSVNVLVRKLSNKFRSAQNELKSSAGKKSLKPEIVNAINWAKFENVGCVTTGRIAKVDKFCKFATVLSSSLMPMLTFDNNNSRGPRGGY